jgi:hypothetical protein
MKYPVAVTGASIPLSFQRTETAVLRHFNVAVSGKLCM